MDEYKENLYEIGGQTSDYFPPPPRLVARERLNIQKSSVCSRAYFLVVMAFFHIYIINIIALLLYVHYNTGSGETSGGEQDVPIVKSTSVPRSIAPDHQSTSPNLSPENSFFLPRLEGIRVWSLSLTSYMFICLLFTLLLNVFPEVVILSPCIYCHFIQNLYMTISEEEPKKKIMRIVLKSKYVGF